MIRRYPDALLCPTPWDLIVFICGSSIPRPKATRGARPLLSHILHIMVSNDQPVIETDSTLPLRTTTLTAR